MLSIYSSNQTNQMFETERVIFELNKCVDHGMILSF